MLLFLKIANRLHGRKENMLLDRAASQPGVAQREFLLKLVRRNEDSAFGRAHGFSRIRSEVDYRRQVPIRDFEAFRPFVDRVIAGENSVLTKAGPFILSMTSGTTGEPKYIPVTRESQAISSSLMRQWLYRAEQDHPGLLDQASVGIASRAIEGYTSSGLPYGSASGLTYKNIPRFVRRAYAVPYMVSELRDYDERYFVTGRFALGADVSLIATPNPSTLVRLAQVCVERQEGIVRAIHDGTLGVIGPLQPDVCARLASRLQPDPARARFLARVIEQSGFLNLSECWPDLKLVGCWIGGSAGAQVRKLFPHYGNVPVRDLGYLASEGRVTIPWQDQTPSGILALCSNYYEFIPEEEADSSNPPVLSSHQLGTGKRYSILLTTAAGLYRYKINDIVEVTGSYRDAPLLAFLRKGGEMTNITGEKMHANHIVQALDEVRRHYSLDIEQFRATPDLDRSRYDIYLELARPVPHALLREEVLPALDRALTRMNVEYEQKRQSKRLAPLFLHLMEKGWAERSLRRHIAAGKRDTQYKWQILCPEQRAEDTRAIIETLEEGSGELSPHEAAKVR
jgi:GH3 auxin-responsive promoter